MRKRMLWLVNLLVVMLFASNAMAEIYAFKNGDTLWSVARANSTTVKKLKELNPKNLANVNVRNIQVGFEIEIPAKNGVVHKSVPIKAKAENKKTEFQRPLVKKADVKVSGTKDDPIPYLDKNVNADPWTGSFASGMHFLGISTPIDAEIHFVDEGIDNINPGELIKMLSGKDKVKWYKSYLSKEKSRVQKLGVIVNGKKVASVWQKPECGNWLTRLIIPPVKIQPPAKKLIPTPPVVQKVTPPFVQPPNQVKCLDNWDAYLGGGNYLNRVEPKYNYGYYFWAKYRNRPCPFWYTPEENFLGIQSVGFGFVGFLAGGKGTAAQYYNYSWLEGTVGATAKVYTPHADYDLDAMVGQLRNKGSWRGVKDRDQIDSIFLLSAHGNQYREGENVKLFPKREFNIEWRIPFHTKMRRGTKVDNEIIEASYTQWIYKFQLGGNNDSFNLSPGFYLGVGYEKSSDDPTFVKLGPALEVSSYGNVVAGLSFFNYKFQSDGQWHPFGAYISPDGAWRAYEASQITSVSEEELRGLENGSKLLANPADYL
ncbi:MAG: hypothetical protein UR66_C0014G0024 [Candidatus Moranbacteria bacterium GW2011_GWE1_35_17]|nr:MAG: hypothetical protein UR66_C0014G0024 [Candidatus Moranbacteria bacterium GW2011_GWE1_35_17]KKP82802.1 MAG: hypothetical protein UR82_C0031G0010 [Candidatus Moranbacteria bacterium GW2011_GWF1_35_5]